MENPFGPVTMALGDFVRMPHETIPRMLWIDPLDLRFLRGEPMKKLLSLFVIAALMFSVGLPHSRVISAENQPIAAAKKIKASVTGTGKSKSEAEREAERAAREVAGGSYTTLRKNSSGSGKNWTATMTIEYTEKK